MGARSRVMCGRSTASTTTRSQPGSFIRRRSRWSATSSAFGMSAEGAPQGAPLLDLEHVLNVAENSATRLCTLCGAAQERTPLLRGFDVRGSRGALADLVRPRAARSSAP